MILIDLALLVCIWVLLGRVEKLEDKIRNMEATWNK